MSIHASRRPLCSATIRLYPGKTACSLWLPAADVGAAVQADQLVRQKQAVSSQLEQLNMQHLQKLHSEAAGYLQDLDDIHDVLQQLVGRCMLQEQPKLQEVRVIHHQHLTKFGGVCKVETRSPPVLMSHADWISAASATTAGPLHFQHVQTPHTVLQSTRESTVDMSRLMQVILSLAVISPSSSC